LPPHRLKVPLHPVDTDLNERPVYNQLGRRTGQLLCSPRLDLTAHRLEIPLHAVDADRDGIDQSEALGILEHHIHADEDTGADGQAIRHKR
jgi:hypothetical protein